ncbi:MAG: hypothetical protein J6X33_07990 [Clostridiales bacterium]|nr:hypothetical protein [Clostridiales bacterium]
MLNKKILPALVAAALIFAGAGCSVPEQIPAVSESKAEVTTKTIADISSGVPDEVVSSLCNKDCYDKFDIVSHNVEASGNGERDTVRIDINGGNPTGALPQTISKDVTFVMDQETSEWKVEEENCIAWDVDNSSMPLSRWKCKDPSSDEMTRLFGGDKGSGEVYLTFVKRIGKITLNLTDDINDPHEHPFSFIGNGTFVRPAEEGNIEKRFKFTEGTVTDEGKVILKAQTDDGQMDLDLTGCFEPVTQKEYDMAVTGKIPEDQVYVDDLATFELTTEDLEGDMWKKQIGSKYENLSPDLSWDAVDGASCYALLMIDHVAWNWVHWYSLTDKTHVGSGEFSGKDQGYAGPIPEDAHEYTVYVVALRTEPANGFFQVDTTAYGEDKDGMFTRLNKGTDGKAGNILSYGVVKGIFDPA